MVRIAEILPDSIADELELEPCCFGLDDPATVESALQDVSLVLNAAGPFSRTALPMVEACLRTQTHYLDVTGEIAVFEAIAALFQRGHPVDILTVSEELRSRGHLFTATNPVRERRKYSPPLDLENFDLSEADLEKGLYLWGLKGRNNALDGAPAGLIGLRDHVRPEAAAAIARLRRSGIASIALLSGDREPKARALAAELGIDLVFAERRPEEKAEVVRALQAEGRRVAFVGDGVNDAPALVAADIGIAMPRGADLARATADVILLRDSIGSVADARVLSDRTLRLIRSNFRWAVGLNTLLFGAAALGYASPAVSAVIHNGVTLGTLGRALLSGRVSETAEIS